jgi:hypothetical protein
VRTEAGPIGPVLDALRVVLEPWLGHGQYESSPIAPKLKFRIEPRTAAASPSASRSKPTSARSKRMIRRSTCRSA